MAPVITDKINPVILIVAICAITLYIGHWIAASPSTSSCSCYGANHGAKKRFGSWFPANFLSTFTGDASSSEARPKRAPEDRAKMSSMAIGEEEAYLCSKGKKPLQCQSLRWAAKPEIAWSILEL